MAAAFVKVTKLENGSGASASGTVSATASNALIAACADNGPGGTNPTLAVSGGATWTIDGKVGNLTPNTACGFGSSPSATGGANTVTVTWGAGNASTAFIYEFSGMATSSMLGAVGSGNNGSGSPISTAAQTNANASDVFVAVTGTNSGSANEATASTGTGWTMPASGVEPNGASFLAAASAYQIVASSAARTETWTINDAVTWESLIACYVQAAGGSGVALTGAAVASALAATAVALVLPGLAAIQAVVAAAPTLSLTGSVATSGGATGALGGQVALGPNTTGSQATSTAALTVLLAGGATTGASASAALSVGLAGAISVQSATSAAPKLSLASAVGAQAGAQGSVSVGLTVNLAGSAVSSGRATNALMLGFAGLAGGQTSPTAAVFINLVGASVGQASPTGFTGTAPLVGVVTTSGGAGGSVLQLLLLSAVSVGQSTVVVAVFLSPPLQPLVVIDVPAPTTGTATADTGTPAPHYGTAVSSGVLIWVGTLGSGTLGSDYLGGSQTIEVAPSIGVAKGS